MAFFVTAHGLGHAARAVAIMAALREAAPRLRIDVFTTVPSSFFLESVPDGLFTHTLTTDVGLVQDSPLHADLGRTLEGLDHFLPFAPQLVEQTANHICKLGSRLIVCDIAPLGIAVARHLGLRSVLVENFTWDWIYEGYAADMPALVPHIDYLRTWFHLKVQALFQDAVLQVSHTGQDLIPGNFVYTVEGVGGGGHGPGSVPDSAPAHVQRFVHIRGPVVEAGKQV